MGAEDAPDAATPLAGKDKGAEAAPAEPAAAPAARGNFLLRGPPLVATPFRKNVILVVVALSGLLGPLTSAIYTPALAIVQADFRTSEILINLTITVATLTLGIAPLGFATAADTLGRRPVLLVASAVAVGGCVGCYYAGSIGLFLFWRIVQSVGCSAGMSVGAGVIADIFDREQRGRAMGTFMLGPLLGPVLSPPIGGALAQYVGWRYIFVFCACYAGFVWLLTFALLPETLKPPAPGQPRATRNPFASFVELRHPFVLLIQVMATIAFASFYTFPPLLPRDWPAAYGFDSSGVGLVLMAMGLGMSAGSIGGGWLADRSLASWKARRGGVVVAEDRLWSSVPGWVLMPASYVAYGWLLQYRVHWGATLTAAVLIGLSQLFFNTSCNTYLVDIFQARAASISALGNFLRFALGAFMPLVVVPASVLSRGVLYSIVAAVNLLGVAGVWWTATRGTEVRVRASPWRERSDAGRVLEAVRRGRAKGGDEETVVAGEA